MSNNDISPSPVPSKQKEVSATLMSKSNLAWIKNIRGFGSFLKKSSDFWKESLQSSLCNCERDGEWIDNTEQINISIDDKLDANNNVRQPHSSSLFKVIHSAEKTLPTKEIVYTKDWTKDEKDIWIYQYYTWKNKNWKSISEIIATKSPQQCWYRIKKLEHKAKVKSFTRQEDLKIMECVDKYGLNWELISKELHGYTPDVIEERYELKLNPKLKRSKFSDEEDKKIINLYNVHGNNWKMISTYFPDRNSNMIKNRFYSFLKKKGNVDLSKHTPSKESKKKSNTVNNNTLTNNTNSGAYTSSYLDTSMQNDSYAEQNPEQTTNGIPGNYEINPNLDYQMNKWWLGENSDFNDWTFNNLGLANSLELFDQGGTQHNYSNNLMDNFDEVYSKIFPNVLAKKMDLDDSGSSDSVRMENVKGEDKNTAESPWDGLNDMKNANNVQIASNNNRITNMKNEQTDKLFDESNRWEELLNAIDLSILESNKVHNPTKSTTPLLESNKTYLELKTKQVKTNEYQSILNLKWNTLKEDYNNTAKSQSNIAEDSTNKRSLLLEINCVWWKLINIGKMKLLLNQQIQKMEKEGTPKTNGQLRWNYTNS